MTIIHEAKLSVFLQCCKVLTFTNFHGVTIVEGKFTIDGDVRLIRLDGLWDV